MVMRRTRTTTNDEQRILTLLAFPHDTTTDHTGSSTSSSTSSSSMVFQVLGGLSLASSVGLGVSFLGIARAREQREGL